MAKLVLIDHAEVLLWRYADRRCELWIVNGAPRLRLFEDDSVLRDFGVTGARDAMQLAATWKASAETCYRPA